MTTLTTEERNRYYASADALQDFCICYTREKEEAFLRFVFEKVTLPDNGPIIELGGGAAVHGRLLAQRYGSRYLFTDLSPVFVENARKASIPARRMDALATGLPDRSVACLILVGVSTIVHDAETKCRQFAECARVLCPGGVAVFISPTYGRLRGMSRMNRDDRNAIESCGMSVVWTREWGMIPGKFWSARLQVPWALLERCIAPLHIGCRSIVIATSAR